MTAGDTSSHRHRITTDFHHDNPITTTTTSSSSSTEDSKTPKKWSQPSCASIIPARVVFVLMGFFGSFLIFVYKTVLSMSIIAMVHPKNGTHNDKPGVNITGTVCHLSGGSGNTTEAPYPGPKYDWDTTVQSTLLGAFFYGYVLTQIPGGVLANRFGGKWIFGVAILITAVMSLLGPLAAALDWRLLMATRIVQGLAEGVCFPVINGMIAQWVPKMERSVGTTVILSGGMLGTFFAMPITALLSKSETFLGSWQASFYLYGAAGVIWFIGWAFLVYESPERHPFISEKERAFILDNGGGLKVKTKLTIPYKEMFTSVPVYAVIITQTGWYWGFLTMLNLLPTYMNTVLKMNVNQNILISGLPYLGQCVWGWAASYVTDRLRSGGRFQITTLRKVNTFIAFIPPAICLALVPFIKCNTILASVLLILALTFNGSVFPGLLATHVDMAPDYAGTMYGIANSIGNIPGFVATIVANQFTKRGDTVENWAPVFYISATIFAVTGMVYVFFATAQEQPWGRSKPEEEVVEERQQKQKKSSSDNIVQQ